MRRARRIAAAMLLGLASWAAPARALGPKMGLAEYGEGNAYVIRQYGSHRIVVIPRGVPVPFGWYLAGEVALTTRQIRGLRTTGVYRLR